MYSAFTETGATQRMKTNQMATETIDSNIFKSGQPIKYLIFNHMFRTTQLNLNLFVMMLTQLRFRLINYQAQIVSSFARLRIQEELYATLSWLVWKIHENKSCCVRV